MSQNDPTQQTPPPPVVPRPQTQPPPAVNQQQLPGPPPAAPPPAPPQLPEATAAATTTALAVPPHSSVDPIEGYETFYCLDSSAKSAHRDLFGMDRVYYVEPNFLGAPVCPRCNRQTSAVPLSDASQLPPHLQAIKERLEKAERGSV